MGLEVEKSGWLRISAKYLYPALEIIDSSLVSICTIPLLIACLIVNPEKKKRDDYFLQTSNTIITKHVRVDLRGNSGKTKTLKKQREHEAHVPSFEALNFKINFMLQC